jgi:hypothetical protein
MPNSANLRGTGLSFPDRTISSALMPALVVQLIAVPYLEQELMDHVKGFGPGRNVGD